MKLTLKEKKQETIGTISFIFKPDQELGWEAGQFMQYILEHPNPDDRKIHRFFTISSAPSEKNIMLTTRFATEKDSSFKKALSNMKIGDQIEAIGPKGDFVIDDLEQSYVFIAGGIGITPFRSILTDLDLRNLPINVDLLYANKTEEIVFGQELESLSAKNQDFKIHYFIDPKRINQASIRETLPNFKIYVYYVSGPEPMVVAMEKELASLGIPKERVKRDYFPGYDWP